MAEKIKMPDGSEMTAEEFRAAVNNNQIAAGPGGTGMQNAIDSGVYSDPYAGGGEDSGGGAYATGASGGGANAAASGGNAAVGATKGNPGTAWGFEAGGAAEKGSAAERSKSIYELRPGEDYDDWVQRVFQQGTEAYGGSLSQDPSNPLGRTPYANWFSRRYQNVVPHNLMLAKLLGNTGSADTLPQDVEGGIQGFMGSGEGRGFGVAGQSQANLGSLNDLLNSYKNGDMANMSDQQRTMLGGLMDDPSLQLSAVNAQLAGGLGANPWASKHVADLGKRMLNDYYQDPVGNDVGTKGTFLQNLLQRLGMAQ